MPKSISITPYALRIIDTSDGSFRTLDDLPNKNTLIRFLDSYLKMRTQNKSIDNLTEHSLKVLSYQVNDSNSIDGILQAGAFGFAADIEHKNTGRKFKRTTNDIEYLPFYFSLHTRAGQDEAILLLQKFGIYGTKSILQDDFSMHIDQNLRDSRLLINPIISDKYVKEIIGGRVKSLSCIRYNVPTDVADDLGIHDHHEDNATMEVRITAKRDKFLSIPTWMRNVVNGWQAHGRMIEINGIEYNDVKLYIDQSGKKKTVKLSDLRKIRMNIDVTEEVEIAADGHPTVESLRHAVGEILPEIKAAIGWKNDSKN